ncbi:MAG: response regulator [Pseudomonadota bacterium]
MKHKHTILIVDDEYLTGLSLSDELREHGYAIVGPYTTTKEAEAALETECPDLAFLDVNLGKGRNSFDLGSKLMERGVKLVFLTGYSELPSDNEDFADTSVLSKPVPIKAALTEIRAQLASV